jgi:hypothetical protein
MIVDRPVRGGLPDLATWSGYPSFAAVPINPAINVMGQDRNVSVQPRLLQCLNPAALDPRARVVSGLPRVAFR